MAIDLSGQPQLELPEYDNPPVAEVVLAVTFESLERFQAPHFGVLWEREFRERFPDSEDQPPLAIGIERPDGLPPTPRTPFFDKPPLRRCWFLNDAKTELVQVQPDFFARNWRRQGSGVAYPRYAQIRDAFVQELGAFHRFVKDNNLGRWQPTQAELTYVNHIEIAHARAHEALSLLRSSQDFGIAQDAEDVNFTVRYRVNDANGSFLGRLTVTATPALIGRERQVIQLVLTARGRPKGADIDGVVGFTDIGHDWIVRVFTQMTTERMHEGWRRVR